MYICTRLRVYMLDETAKDELIKLQEQAIVSLHIDINDLGKRISPRTGLILDKVNAAKKRIVNESLNPVFRPAT